MLPRQLAICVVTQVDGSSSLPESCPGQLPPSSSELGSLATQQSVSASHAISASSAQKSSAATGVEGVVGISSAGFFSSSVSEAQPTAQSQAVIATVIEIERFTRHLQLSL